MRGGLQRRDTLTRRVIEAVWERGDTGITPAEVCVALGAVDADQRRSVRRILARNVPRLLEREPDGSTMRYYHRHTATGRLISQERWRQLHDELDLSRT